jgi:hypothetical protein
LLKKNEEIQGKARKEDKEKAQKTDEMNSLVFFIL